MLKPSWLDKRFDHAGARPLRAFLRDLNLHTVCEESLCPNIGECFSRNTATFLIMGKVCTRQCRFCNVSQGVPLALDKGEPSRLAAAVKRLMLKYAVITSPTRDDLADGGAGHFSACAWAVKKLNPSTRIELLIPDFGARPESLALIAGSFADVLGHNLETVPSLYIKVRKGSSYDRSLGVLSSIRRLCPGAVLKSGLMLGLGEKEPEVVSVMQDLRKTGCSILTLGQYLAPSLKHYPVQEYIPPEMFTHYAALARDLGFSGIMSSPYTRSSYRADQA
jgi:lipoic acid synthetase